MTQNTNSFLRYIMIATFLWLASSCYEDLGNYDYSEINEVQIGLEEEYMVLSGEQLTITPELSFTMDENADMSNYEFEWVGHRPPSVLAADRIVDIATTQNLDITVKLIPDTYTLYYRVKDLTTGVTWTSSCTLKVRTSIYEGWMVMCDDNGHSRLDMISLIDGEHHVFNNILERVGSNIPQSYLDGKPIGVNCYAVGPGNYGIYVMSENGTTRIDQETFMWDESLDIKYEFVTSVEDGLTADAIYDLGGNSSYLVSNGDFYYYYRVWSLNYGFPLNRLNSGETFKISKYIAKGGFYSAILYDTTNKRFVSNKGTTGYCALMPEGTLFDYNTGKDLVYMAKEAGNANSGTVTAILKDPASGQHYIARIATGASLVQTYYEELNIENIDQVTHFAVSPDFPYLFYSIGDKVYEYDMSLKQTFEMLDLDGRTITKIDFHDNGGNQFYNKLMVCSYDEAAGGNNGTLDFYEVGPVNGPLSLWRSHTGLGKIVGVDYRQR